VKPKLRHLRRLTLATLTLGLLAVGAAGAGAATPEPALSLHILAAPTSFSAADNAECVANVTPTLSQVPCDIYRVSTTNTGAKATSGAIISLSDSLPPGLTVLDILAYRQPLSESPVAVTEDCKVQAGVSVSCKFPFKLAPDEAIELLIAVQVGPGAVAGGLDTAAVSGGGAPAAGATEVLRLDAPPPFGPFAFEPFLSAADGSADAVAGGHPYEYVTRLDLSSAQKVSPADTHEPTSVEDLKDAIIDLPPGLIGAATAAPYCELVRLASVGGCPRYTRVGQILTEPNSNASANSGLFNIAPEQGVAAEFGFTDALDNVHVIYASVAPTPQGYVVRATTPDAPAIPLTNVVATFFGDPAAKNGAEGEEAMFTNPAACSGEPLTTHVYLDSWQNPGSYRADGSPNLADPAWARASAGSPAVTGCEELHFEPTLEAVPSTERADSPTGLDVNLKVPQAEGFEELSTPPLRDAVVTLPEGLVVNPSSANGLGACSLAQIGMSASGEPDAAQPTCPDDSKIGTVELETPALPGVLQGQIYVAKQVENPFGSLLAIYIVVDDPTTGILVKLAGRIETDEATGRLTTVIENSPQFPFSELRTHFFSGNRAALRTPATCGSYAVSTQLTPWSAPESGPPATPQGPFRVSRAAGTGSCPTSNAALPNHPSFQAGSTNPLAGAFAPFVLHGARADGDQAITRVNVTLPKGLTGKLAGVPYCPESAISLARSREHLGGGAEEIASPACPAASEVGVVHVGAGAGPEPYYVTGHAYLAGPYEGAPLSVVIVSPAVAGPFDLGSVVVRAALSLNLETAQISATSDPIPTILHGIPLDIRSITLEMSRPEFTLNPTNCEKMAVSGEAVGQFGSVAALSNPFQVGGCRNLRFRPKLSLQLKGSTKRAGHPALKAVLTYPKGSGYANIAYAQVGLPGTEFLDQGNLNKVCTQPELRSATCPPTSIYGHAKAWSPLLEAPLEGPVYLGVGFGHKLPDLVADLGGQIRILLHGKVDSDPEKGLRNTFEVVPDAPVSRFVLTMKGGKRYGLLENTAGVCARPQRAAVRFIAQNGLERRYRQKIANGCGKKGGHRRKGHGGKGGSGGGHRRHAGGS